MTRIKPASLILAVALALGLLWDLLFYAKPLGISALLFVLLLTAALVGIAHRQGVLPAWRNLWLLAPLLFCAAMVFVRANPFLTFLNVAAGLALLGLLAHFYAAGWLGRTGLIEYPLLLLQVGGNALVRAAPLVSASVDLTAAREQGRRSLLPVARGCLLALPVLLVFTCLLASADLIFAKYLEDIWQIDFLADLLEWFWRGILVLVVAWLAAGGQAYALGRAGAPDDKGALVKAIDSLGGAIRIGFVEVAILLASVDLLFTLFVWIQFVYLFGGQANIGVEGYTYAEYARRGFFELVAVSLLTLGMILSLHQVGRRETGRQKLVFNALSSLMVALVLVMLASAFKRLLLYEAAYGYTQLRLYSHVFMAWLAFAFAWFLITLWLQPDGLTSRTGDPEPRTGDPVPRMGYPVPRMGHFPLGAFVAALGFVITLNLVNPDAFIARQNLARYQAIGKLDVYYLAQLSDDAVPTLIQNVDRLASADRQVLNENLGSRLEHMQNITQWRRWPSFHLSRQRAYRLLVERK